jgi:hypothetical protein
MEISIFTLLNTESAGINTKSHPYQSCAMDSSELWVGTDSNKLLAIHPSAYYDNILKDRRNSDKMNLPWLPSGRLIHIG